MRTLAYLRVSTELQAQGNSVESQRFQLRCLFAARGLDYGACREFVDEGLSGGTMNRPAVRELIATIEAGGVDLVAVYDMDRLSRDPDDRSAFIKLCAAKGAAIFDARGELDTRTPEGKLMERVKAAVSEYERAKIRQRISSGVRSKMANGERWGGARVVDPERNGCARLTPAEWAALYARRHQATPEQLAQAAGVHPRTVRKRFAAMRAHSPVDSARPCNAARARA